MKGDISECLATYGCGNERIPEVIYQDGAVFTPFVEITVQGERVLTTGNESSPSVENHAMITSFQYGTSTGTGGCGMKVEVADEGGVMFKKFTQSINKDITKVQSQLTGVPGCKAEFGWYVKKCDNSVIKITNEENPPLPPYAGPVHFLPVTLETNFNEGVIKFVFEGVDLFVRSFDARLEKPMADEGSKINLKDALRKLFTEKDPTFTNVCFRRWNGQGEFDFKNNLGGPPGHKSTHPTEQESNVTCARKWLMQNRTDLDLGVLVVYEPGDRVCTPGSVVFQEDPEGPDKPPCCQNSIGTYVVNGGNRSPVISFNPSIKWPLGGNAGDGGVPSGSATGQSNRKANEKLVVKAQNTGSQISHNIHQEHSQHQPPEEQPPIILFNSTAHNRASKPYEAMVSAIDAELKIMGDPSFVSPIMLTGKSVSLVVIEPYYFEGGSDWADVGDWLAQPTCNSILSNKNWLILGCDHQITSGQYFTTFKLRLAAPNIDIDAGDTFGGCGTEVPLEATDTEPQK